MKFHQQCLRNLKKCKQDILFDSILRAARYEISQAATNNCNITGTLTLAHSLVTAKPSQISSDVPLMSLFVAVPNILKNNFA